VANNSNRVLLANYLLAQQASTLGKNYVLNQMALQNTANVSASGTATVARNTTTPLTAISDFAITLPNNATDGVTWTLGTLDNAVKNQNCELRLDYIASSIGSNVLVQVLQGSNVVAQSSALALASASTTVSVNAPCGDLSAATTVRIQNDTGNSGTSAINVANVTYGKATNLSSSQIVTPWVAYTPTFGGQFGTVTNIKFQWRRVGDSLDVSGTATVGTRNTSLFATISFPNSYTIDTNKVTIGNTTSGEGQMVGQFAQPGANDFGPVVTATATDASVVYLSGSTTSATMLTPNTNSGLVSNTIISIRFTVPITQFSQVQTYNPELQALSWSGYTNSISGGCSTTSTTFADPSGCTGIALTELTNRNFGTVTTAGSSLPGITFTPAKSGRFFVCSTPAVSNSSAGADMSARLTDGTTVFYQGSAMSLSTANNASNVAMCGIYNATSTSPVTIKIQMATSTGTLKIATGIQGGGTVSNINWSIVALDQQIPAPVLVGSVTSNSTGGERIERAELNCDAASSITSQSGTWLSAIGNRSTAACTITIASGIFSATPSCVFTVKATAVQATAVNMTSATAGTVYGASADYDGYLICMGPR